MTDHNWTRVSEHTQQQARRYRKIVIWGLRSLTRDSFRYIMDHYSTTLQKLSIPTVWVDDNKDNQRLVEKGDLVIAANVSGKYLPVSRNVFYCLHNFNKEDYRELDPKKVLVLQVYSNDADKGTKKWDAVTRFDKKNRTLYQPWGTNLLPWEFMEPVFPKMSPLVFWVGSIWDNDQHQGNIEAIAELRKQLWKHHIHFIQVRVPDPIHIQLMRFSRIAPAIGGNWQVKTNYLPCRMFKNVSYGQLGITNIRRFKDLLGNSFLEGKSIAELVDKALGLPEKKFRSQILAQQEIMKTQTYLQKLNNIFTALEEIT